MHNPLQKMRITKYNASQCSNIHGPDVRNGGAKPHWGWDLVADIGTEVFAVSDGWITAVDKDPNNPSRFGIWVQLEFTYKEVTYWALYAHLSKVLVEFKKGERELNRVTEGKAIAYSGDTGNARGEPQLHIEFRKSALLTKKYPRKDRVSPSFFFGKAPLDEGVVCPWGS